MPNPTVVAHASAKFGFRLCACLLMCSLSLAAQTAQSEENQMDVFALKIAHANTNQLDMVQLSSTVASVTTSNLVFGKMLRLPTLSELKKGVFWTASIRWNYTDDGIKSSLSPRLRFESKESRIELNPLKHKVSITWRRELN